MAIIQCKICGGEIDVPRNLTIGECPYCHELTTFPRFDIPDIEALYRQAENARLSCNFDKAISFYEEIIDRESADPEIYWGLVLSSWGIEYVEDPLTKERKPTCHRVQYESILDDESYKKVIELSDGDEAQIYQQEAQKISDIQKNILKISAQEKPYDIFICYKESDDSGQRTEDSLFAQDLYDKLCAQGYKVFFARVTLEDKVGLYEPYIFAALNSAKVMLVIGSKKEYFEAAWVRNEWSRFLFMMQQHTEKVLIPCYRDIDAYDIPREMSMFQAQDMNKIGFSQDLLHGLSKVLGNKVQKNAHDNKTRKFLILFGSLMLVFALIITVLLTKNSTVQPTISVSSVQPTVPVKRKKFLAKPPQKNENPVVKKLKKYLVIDLSSGPNSSNYPVRSTDTPPDVNDDKCRTTELWLRRIEPGEFMMGAPTNVSASLKAKPQEEKPQETKNGAIKVKLVVNSSFEEDKYHKSLPMHKVKITKPYYIGIFEITQAQYLLVMGETSIFKTENKKRNPLFPMKLDIGFRARLEHQYSLKDIMNGKVIDNIRWPSYGHNVSQTSFLGKLRERTKLLFDLPTEAQWEYACRAGTKSGLYSGYNLLYGDSDPHLDEIANYGYNSKRQGEETLMKVGSYKPNEWGLYDMLGNGSESCLDLYDIDVKGDSSVDPLGSKTSINDCYIVVQKGGNYYSDAFKCCSYSRAFSGTESFRIAFFPTPLVPSNFGFSYDPSNNSVDEVAPDFPAEKAGIQEGDVLIEVNGKSLKNNKWADLVKPTDSSVKVKFKRGDKIMTTTMSR